MKAIDVSFVHGRLNRAKDGKKQIELRVYFPQTRERVYKSTGVWAKHFSEGKIGTREENHTKLSRIIKQQRDQVQELYDDFILKKKDFTSGDLRRFYAGEDVRITFNKFFQEVLGKQAIRYSTYQNKLHTLTLLNEYNPSINFAQLDYTLIDSFNSFLAEKGMTMNTIYKIHSHMKSIITEAINMDYILKSPYGRFQVKKERKVKYALTKEQVLRIYQQPKSLTRDAFLLSCCTGLRFSDVIRLTQENIKEVDGELYVVLDEMKKVEGRGITNKINLVFDFGEELVRSLTGEYLCPVSHSHANIELKNIQSGAISELKKPLTFHISRHTYLTHVAAKTGSIFAVMKHGGISNVSTAQGYVDMANSNLIC